MWVSYYFAGEKEILKGAYAAALGLPKRNCGDSAILGYTCHCSLLSEVTANEIYLFEGSMRHLYNGTISRSMCAPTCATNYDCSRLLSRQVINLSA